VNDDSHLPPDRISSRSCPDLPNTEQIMLEQNYRSTGSILSVSLAIVSQGRLFFVSLNVSLETFFISDKSRIPKTLLESHPTGPRPVLCSFSSEHEEVTFIAMEIKRVVANMGGVLNWGDFAILRGSFFTLPPVTTYALVCSSLQFSFQSGGTSITDRKDPK
jgi:superfamily I DNA/RNA helicase